MKDQIDLNQHIVDAWIIQSQMDKESPRFVSGPFLTEPVKSELKTCQYTSKCKALQIGDQLIRVIGTATWLDGSPVDPDQRSFLGKKTKEELIDLLLSSKEVDLS